MAKSEVIVINKLAPTLLFSGVGNVVIQAYPAVKVGGADVTSETGIPTAHLAGGPLHVTSPDKIYGILDATLGPDTFPVYVFHCR